MPDIDTEVDGRKVVANGVIVCKMHEIIKLRPFAHQPGYVVEFQVKVAKPGHDHRSNIFQRPDGSVVIEHTHKVDALLGDVIVNNTVFASDSNSIYTVNYHIKLVGDDERYSIFLAYMMLAEPR